MRMILKLSGVTGLVMHSPAMADPENEIVKAIESRVTAGRY